MKKIYTICTALIAAAGFSQSVVITRVVDGTLAADGCSGTSGSSNPKIVELYVSGTVNLTNYRVQTESNGAADAGSIAWNAGCDLTSLGSVTNSFIYLVGAGTTTFSEVYPSLTPAAGLTNVPNGNGNDAYRVATFTEAGTAGTLVAVIDQYGDPLQITGSDDYSAAWAYQDSYAKRNNGVPANGGNFVASTFTYGGNGAFAAPNNTCAVLASSVDLGTFTLGVNENAIAGLKIFPNPVSNGNLFISTATNGTKAVSIYDVLGKQVIKTSVQDQAVNVASLKSGVYIVKVTEEGKTATRKLVIK